MSDHIVLDIETAIPSEQVEGGLDSTQSLGVGCAVVYSVDDDLYETYSESNLQELKERLLAAGKITGFNIYRFDFPVIWAKSRSDWTKTKEAKQIIPKTNDLLRRIWISLGLNPDEYTNAHRGWSLDNVSRNTLNKRKTGNGAWAVEWLKAGRWDLVVNYCMMDVKMTFELSTFIDKYGYVIGGREKTLIPIWAAANEVQRNLKEI